MSESTCNDKDELKTNDSIEKIEEIVSVDEKNVDVITIVSTYGENNDLENIEIIEVVEEFEEIPNLEESVDLEKKNKVEDISPEFTKEISEIEEKPTIEENAKIETVVNSKNAVDSNKSSLKVIQEKSNELIKSSKENLENNKELEKAFDKSKEVTVNLVEYVKKFVKKPIDTIENVDISVLETSVLAIVQLIIIYFAMGIIYIEVFNFVKATVYMAIAYVVFIAITRVATYVLHTEFDVKGSYKWFATLQIPFAFWLVIGAIMCLITHNHILASAFIYIGFLCAAFIGTFSAKKVVNASRDKLAYAVPAMIGVYWWLMIFITDQL